MRVPPLPKGGNRCPSCGVGKLKVNAILERCGYCGYRLEKVKRE